MPSRARSLGLPALSLSFALLGLPAVFAQPEPAPPAAKAVDPKVAAAQTAFEALPEATRIAIQNDLVWTTPFSGAALGTFGRLTYEAVGAFQKQIGQPVDGVLTEKQRLALGEAAKRARSGVAFSILTDPVTGSGIGIPATILVRQEKVPVGSKWSSQSGDVTLETVRTAPDKADMAATFDRFVTAPVQGRKVTYKLLRPDFFVVTGDMGPKKFYTRFAPTPEGLRGFTLTYDATLSPGIDRIVIAIANTFEPLRAQASSPPSASTAAKGQPLPGVPAALSPVQPTAPTERVTTALVLPGSKVLTSAKGIESCKSLIVAGKPATAAANDTTTGLAILSVPGLAAPASIELREEPLKADEALVAFGFDGNRPQRHLSAAPGPVRISTSGSASMAVALQAGGSGSLVLDRQGRIAALVLDMPPLNRQIAGTVPLANYAVSPSTAIKAFLTANGVSSGSAAPAGSDESTGLLSGRASKLVLAASCAL